MIRFLALVFVLTTVSHLLLNAQKEDDDKKSMTFRMAQAWISFNEEDYNGALRIYRELYNDYPTHAVLNLRMGQCFVELSEMDSALIHLSVAVQADSTVKNEAYFLIGKVYHYRGDLDRAIENFFIYKNRLSPSQNEKDYVNVLLQQCHTAKTLIENPVNVQISSLGPNINTKYVDASPSVTADGKTLIFTSRRPENTGGMIDMWSEDYYDDIYISTYDEKAKEWTPAVNIGAPINTESHDANMSISPDGSTIFIYKNVINETKSGDIYFSVKKPTGEWSETKPLDTKYINSTYFESSASITADGNTIYFVSERQKEGYGQADIYMSKKEGKEWSKPVNMGPVVNSVYDEIGVYIHPDGKTLFFSSNGHKTMGGYDIFMTIYENGSWSEPINLGYPINTTRDEVHFVLGTDRKTAYISSSRDGGYGKYDIYKVDMSYYFKSNKDIPDNLANTVTGPPLSILKGRITDAESNSPVKANIIIKDLTDNKTHITSSDDNGEYFITLPADRKYEINVQTKGYKVLNVKFKLPKGETETYTMTKHLLLNKE